MLVYGGPSGPDVQSLQACAGLTLEHAEDAAMLACEGRHHARLTLAQRHSHLCCLHSCHPQALQKADLMHLHTCPALKAVAASDLECPNY